MLSSQTATLPVMNLFFKVATFNEKACPVVYCLLLAIFSTEGLKKTRNMKILTLTGEGAGQLHKYDWPQKSSLSDARSTQNNGKKGITMDDGSKKMITVNDVHLVVRSKAYVPLSGTIWANETHTEFK